MNVIGIAGYSGAGKTQLIEAMIPVFKARGQRVSVVKHAHHRFDIDHPGKDSHRHREAGAFEVVIASSHRLALVREFEQAAELSVHHLIAELWDGVDWVLVEGFRHADLPKIEVWRAATGHTAHYPGDAFVAAIATDSPAQLPQATQRPVLDLNQPAAVADWLLAQGARFAYDPSRHHPAATA
ncbi:MAG: molybdopterin-guanine dinucleotide biosynthesis protein B [Comamonadaceae bacterium]|nr:molybdopterin-guanine dinucleotide biosynthesis protein B [Comamonadaceae bacterium]RRD58441.1 molybdopterin-guanine dinucleotide biosynthesis protein B [Comamonadaceae bacterium OH2545_COT-014]